MKKFVAVAVAITFVLAFAAPVFAQSMTHDAAYKMDGTIDIEKQVGHLCNTGAEMKQTIKGEGEMTKVMDTVQVAGKLTVSDDQDWVTAEDAVRNLTVTSVIELCAPPKSIFAEDVEALQLIPVNGPVPFAFDILPTFPLSFPYAAHEGAVIPVNWLYGYLQYGDPYNAVDPLTDQIWAVQVEADAGFSGGLTQDFEAAYGPWNSHHGYLGSSDNAWWFVDEDGNELKFGKPSDINGPVLKGINGEPFGLFDRGGYYDIEVGDDYVGNYFNIDQMARTSQGTTKRYISISSPWSHAYLMEDMTVVGMSEITESFSMDNIVPGEEAVPDWWDLF